MRGMWDLFALVRPHVRLQVLGSTLTLVGDGLALLQPLLLGKLAPVSISSICLILLKVICWLAWRLLRALAT
jgi:hypothetical protein